MEPLEYLRILRRRWPLVAGALLVALVAAWATTPSRDEPNPEPPQRAYTATHVLIQDPGAPADSEIGLDLMAFFATTGEVPVRVAARLGGNEEPAVLASQVQVTADTKLGSLTFTTTDRDADRATLLANTFAEETLAWITERREQTVQQSLEASIARQRVLEEQIRELERRLVGLDPDSVEAQLLTSQKEALLRQFSTAVSRGEELASQVPQPVGLYTLQAATPMPILQDVGFTPPSSRSGRLGIGMVLGLVLGVALALVLERLDIRVRTRRGAERAFGLPVISEIPRLSQRLRRGAQVVVVSQPASFAAEAYRILRLSLQLMPRWILPTPSIVTSGQGSGPAQGADGNGARPQPTRGAEGSPRVILVTSPGPGEGKTSTVANLAASFAEVGKVVLALDCDVRHPELHRYLGVEQGAGVTDYLAGGVKRPPLERLAKESSIPGVWVVPSGTIPENPGELLGPDQDLIATAAEFADVVLLDAGPVLTVNDPAALLPMVDAVVVVARSGQTTAEAAYRTSELLARLEAPLLGVALVGVPRNALGRRYHGQYSAPLDGRRWPLARRREAPAVEVENAQEPQAWQAS